MKIECKGCGMENEAGSKFCGKCGAELNSMMEDNRGFPMVVCRSCTKQVNAQKRYCPYCGTKISEVDITPPDPAEPFKASPTEFETTFKKIKQDVKDSFEELKSGGKVGEGGSGKAKEKIDEIFDKK